MWLIVGLGNPGRNYELTRHNCGFMVVDEMARRALLEFGISECQASTTRSLIGGREVLLVKPQTFMNLSGVAVACLRDKYGIEDNSSLLVISDDLALPFGKIRIRRQGSAGGHNGLKSIIARLGTQEFARIRMGIAPDHQLNGSREYVLAEFPRKDRQELALMVGRTADAVEDILTNGIAEAMTKYN